MLDVRRILAIGVIGALTVAAAAFGKANTLKISVSPGSGGYGTVYAIKVTGKVGAGNEQLALTMTSTPGKCSASYTKGFSTQSGIAGANGQPIAPKAVRKGRLAKTIKAKITISDPGAYGICAYLQVGAVTKAHAATVFTITQ